ncbi:MAG: sulfatase [Planctomycetota bacterium]
MRFALLIRVFQASFFASFLTGSLTSSIHAAQPNILLIVIDDLRWDTLGYAGHPVVKTPHIDRLAGAGFRFTESFVTTSICCTSRASLLTGQYERRHGIDNFRKSFRNRAFAETFPALLKKNGYRTAFVGKWGLGGPLPRNEYYHFKGFSGQGQYYQKERKLHLTDLITEQSLSFLREADESHPFCLQVSFKAVHCQDGHPWPFQPAKRYASRYENHAIPVPPHASEAEFQKLPAFLQNSEARRRWKIRFSTPELYQKSVKDYLRLITGVDDAIGRMVETLKSRGLDKNTVAIFTSDNGFYLGERGLAGKWFMHEESIRVPLFIYDPTRARAGGREVTHTALNIDLAPTILDFAGLKAPESMQGRSLLPVLDGNDVAWRRDWLYEHRFQHGAIPQCEGVRTSRWKFVRFTKVRPRVEELYDLQNDPRELTNLASDPEYATVLEDLRERWKELRDID